MLYFRGQCEGVARTQGFSGLCADQTEGFVDITDGDGDDDDDDAAVALMIKCADDDDE